MIDQINVPIPEVNRDMRQVLQDLSPLKQKQWIRGMDQSARRYLIACLQDGQMETNENNLVTSLKLDQLSKEHLHITRASQNRSAIGQFLACLRKIIWICLSEIAYWFGFLTVFKTERLINSYLKRDSQENGGAYISQGQLASLLEEMGYSGAPLSLKEMLEARGYEPKLVGLVIEPNQLKEMDLEGMQFEECRLDETDLSGCLLQNLVFTDCILANVSFATAQLEECRFEHCVLQEVMLPSVCMRNVVFARSDLICCSFEDATLTRCLFESVSMPAAHFLMANIESCDITKSELHRAVFFDALQAFNVDEHSLATLGIDRPKTALPVPLHALGWAVPNAFAKLDRQANLIPLRLANTCGEAVAEQIRNEVEHALEELDEAMDVVRVDGGSIPIPQRLLNQIFDAPETYPACTQIIKKIERLSSELDAFFLPGGNDLPPRLYGQQQAEETLFNGDYYQSVMELAMVYYAVNRGIPLMGICRGFQLVNVFFGAQLIQDLIGHYGKIQTYAPLKLEKEPAEMGVVPSPYRGLCDEAVQNYIVSISAHHQAVLINQGPTEYIEPTITYSDVLKAAEPKFPAAPMILLQFHPDLYGGTVSNNFEEQWGNIACDIIASSTNDKFWKILHDSALANKRKKECLNGLKALPI